MQKKYKTNNIDDTQKIYSILRAQYPDNEINIEYLYNTKEYILQVSDKIYTGDPEIPIDLNIKVVYGDSVVGNTPLLLKDPETGLIHIETISSLITEEIPYPEFKLFDKTIKSKKVYSETKFQVWSDSGWVDIKKVIKHKTSKKIYKILTHTGLVEVTEDHSLLDEHLNILKPIDCTLNTKLLCNYPDQFHYVNNTISINKAIIYGFFFGDGSCGKYKCKSGTKYTWALNNSDLKILGYLKHILEIEYPNTKFTIDDTLDSSGVYKLRGQNPKFFVDEYRSIFYDIIDKYKKVPLVIINSENDIIDGFFRGYWMADGCRKDKELIGCTRFDNKGKIGSSGLYFLMRKLGYKVSINTRNDKEDIYRMTLTKNKQRKTNNEIKKISHIDMGEIFVYDLETESGRFNAGIGDIIVKNTDSCMISFKYNSEDYDRNRLDTFKFGILCGQKLTKSVFNRHPIEMEFEKVFQPFVLLSKKRYIAKKFDDTRNPLKCKGIDAKGIALTRRDYCKLVKDCYSDIIGIVTESQNRDDIVKSIDVFKSYITRLDNFEIPVSDLIISGKLANTYKNKPTHAVLADKLKERKQEVSVGERIQYIFIHNNDPKIKKTELGEDPDYAVKNNLQYNRLCYIDQLSKPIIGFYKVVLNDYPELLDDLISFLNTFVTSYNSKPYKKSDFKIAD